MGCKTSKDKQPQEFYSQGLVSTPKDLPPPYPEEQEPEERVICIHTDQHICRPCAVKPLELICISPEPGCCVEADGADTVLQVLQRMAVQFGVDMEDAKWLQLTLSDCVLPHNSTLQAAGLCDKAEVALLGVADLRDKARCVAIDLIVAAANNRMEDVRLVTKFYPDRMNAEKDFSGSVALHWAAAGNCIGSIKLLLAAKAAVSLKDNIGRTALQRAVDNDAFASMEMLSAAGATLG